MHVGRGVSIGSDMSHFFHWWESIPGSLPRLPPPPPGFYNDLLRQSGRGGGDRQPGPRAGGGAAPHGPGASPRGGVWEEVGPDETAAPAQQDTHSSAILEAEPEVGPGPAGALKLAMNEATSIRRSRE